MDLNNERYLWFVSNTHHNMRRNLNECFGRRVMAVWQRAQLLHIQLG